MAVSTELQPIIDALIKSNKDAADRIIFNENRTAESIKEKLEAVDKDGNLKIQGALRESLEFEQEQIEETKKNRKIAEASVNLEKQNIELMKQANAKVQKTIEDNGGKVEDNTGFLQNQVEIAKAELDLRKKQLSDPTQAQMLSIGRDELELEKLRFKAEGKRAEDNLDFQKRTNELRKAEARERLQQEGLSASARKEASKDLRAAQIEGLKLALDPVISPLQTVAGFINKGIGKIIPGFTFGRLAGLVGIGLLIKFLRSPIFDDIISALVDFDIKNIGDGIKRTIDGLQNALTATAVVIGSMAARLIGATGFGKKADVKTKLTAKGIGIKADEVITDKSGRTFKLTAGGDLREFVKDASKPGGQKFLPPPKGGQDALLRSLASEGSLGNRGSLVIGKSGSLFRSITGILKKVPILSRIFAIGDLISILGDDTIATGEKAIQLTSLLGGLGGGALGSILGGLLGTALIPIPGLGSFVGSLGGGVLGYFLGKASVDTLARGIAEFALGMNVSAFPPFDFLGMTVDLNRILNSGKGEKAGQTVTGGAKTVTSTAGGAAIDAPEGTVMRDMGYSVFNPRAFATRRFIELDDGTFVSPFTGAPSAPGIFGEFREGIDYRSMSSMDMSSLQSAENATLLAQNATLSATNFDGGGSVAVVNAVTNNDNKQASNFFPMNVVERPQGFVKDATNALLA